VRFLATDLSMHRDVFRCGPLEVTVGAQTPALYDKVADTLQLYNACWAPPFISAQLRVDLATAPALPADGNYLNCSRMRVDATAAGLRATCHSGAACESDRQRWRITIPSAAARERVPDDVEDLIGLTLATLWRQAGWVPLHAGAVAKGRGCALLTAPSGGGKTTLTAALIRRGWQTLGDDKLLLRVDDGGVPEARALLHNFNLHPDTRRWFDEVGDLRTLPVYSAWTEKRRVSVDTVWPGRTLHRHAPTHLIQIVRRDDTSGVAISPLDHGEILSTLLRQTVIPREPTIARRIVTTVAATAKRLTGWRLDVGAEAYRDPECLQPLEVALR